MNKEVYRNGDLIVYDNGSGEITIRSNRNIASELRLSRYGNWIIITSHGDMVISTHMSVPCVKVK